MKVGGYKLSALEIESILLEVGFLLFFHFGMKVFFASLLFWNSVKRREKITTEVLNEEVNSTN